MDTEVLKILIEASKSVQSVYLNNFWTTMGSYLVAFGWLLTSKEAREYLSLNKKLLMTSIVISIGVFYVHCAVLVSAYYESVELAEQIYGLNLGEANTHTARLSQLYEIPWYWPLVSGCINGAVAILLLGKLEVLNRGQSA